MRFYFAWVTPEETAWDEAFAREDEAVFSVSLQHSESDFPSLEIEVINPRIGLLAPARKQWVWLSYRTEAGVLTPLFHGRLVGVPQEMLENVVKLVFVARPLDYETQKGALAEALRVAPYYDPAWLNEEERADPDRVLEGRSALWHIDRVTNAVTISDIITGEDGQLDYDEDEVIRDSVATSFSASPASRCVVTAAVTWQQAGSGTINITRMVRQAFDDAGPPDGLIAVDGQPRTGKGMINVALGDALVDAWPKAGQNIGGGWSVAAGTGAKIVGEIPLPPILAGEAARNSPNGGVPRVGPLQGAFNSAWEAIQRWEMWATAGAPTSAMQNAIQSTFDRSPGFVVGIVDYTKPIPRGPYTIGGNVVHGDIDVMWVPVWQIAPKMILGWEASRERTETLTFTVEADVQPLLTDPGESETILINLGPVNVDQFIPDVRLPRYFASGPGADSVKHLLARARVALLARARCVEVSFSVPFEEGLTLSCRKSASIVDPRLPGGVAAGKVKAYTLSADGDSGELLASLVIGCTIGRDGDVEAVEGEPDYCVEDYTGSDYQDFEGAVLVPFAGDLGYTLNQKYGISDDGVRLTSIKGAQYVESVEITGGLNEQMEVVQLPNGGANGTFLPWDSAPAAVSAISGLTTNVRIEMKPVTGGPFSSTVAPVVTELKVPRTIDLEET